MALIQSGTVKRIEGPRTKPSPVMAVAGWEVLDFRTADAAESLLERQTVICGDASGDHSRPGSLFGKTGKQMRLSGHSA